MILRRNKKETLPESHIHPLNRHSSTILYYTVADTKIVHPSDVSFLSLALYFSIYMANFKSLSESTLKMWSLGVGIKLICRRRPELWNFEVEWGFVTWQIWSGFMWAIDCTGDWLVDTPPWGFPAKLWHNFFQTCESTRHRRFSHIL